MWRGGLAFDGMRALTDRQVTAFTNWNGHTLSLRGLDSLTLAQAETLANFRGKYLILGGIESTDWEAVVALSEFRGDGINVRDWNKDSQRTFYQARYNNQNNNFGY